MVKKMIKSSEREKNTVEAKNQVERIFEKTSSDSTGVKVLFIGNSITRHGVREDIGWKNDCGMAASSPEKDYVHILEEKILTYDKNASFLVGNFAEWERHFYEIDSIKYLYTQAIDFSADIVVIRVSENVQISDLEKHDFEVAYKELIDTFANNKNAYVVLSTGFWQNQQIDNAIRNVSKKYDYPLIELGFLGEIPQMKALGLFEHEGVANHPGDLGMKAIAEAIWMSLKTRFIEKL